MKSELTVIDEVSGEEVSCASLLKVLADPTRLAVVEQLLNGPMHVGQINESLGVEPTLLSHHLRILRDANLVTSQREGKHVSVFAGKIHSGTATRSGYQPWLLPDLIWLIAREWASRIPLARSSKPIFCDPSEAG